jgi:hypothetical protein
MFMKNLICAALFALAIPFSAQAQNADFGIVIGGGNDDGVSFDFRIGDDGFAFYNNDLFVPTRRVCGIQGVWIEVDGGDVEIFDLDIVDNRGRVQDIRVRQYFRAGSSSNVKPVHNRRGCIVGFKLDAETLGRWRGSRARVTLWGEQLRPNGRIRDIELGSTRVDDYYNRIEWHGRWQDRDQRDGDGRNRRDRRDRVQFCINGFCFGN